MSQANGARAKSQLRLQRAAVEKLKCELFAVDLRAQSSYIKRFLREFQHAESSCSMAEVLTEAVRADVIYIADYHALPATQAFAVRFINQLSAQARRKQELVLCLEVFYARHQRLLEAYLSGQLSEPEFLRRIRYEAEWGYPWSGYRSLLELARQRGLAVFGIDCEPRHNLRLIARRDSQAADQIIRIASQRRQAQIAVLFGESHLAANHLPGKVQRRAAAAGLELQQVIIAQNVDELYWKWAAESEDRVEAVRLAPGKYCVFTATPLEKYQAYKRAIERWQAVDDHGEGETAVAFYHTLDTLLDLLKINKYRHRLRSGQLLIDVWPEVYDDYDFSDFAALLEHYEVDAKEIKAVRRRVQSAGCVFVPWLNAIFVEAFNLVSASEEVARFLAAALRGELWEQARTSYPTPLDRFTATVLDEALVFFASKLLVPQRAAPLLLLPELSEEHCEAWAQAAGLGQARLEMLSRFFVAHQTALRQAINAAPAPIWFDEIISNEGALFEVATRYVGRLLGEQLYQAHSQGEVAIAEIKRLFSADFTAAGSAARYYHDWVRRLGRP